MLAYGVLVWLIAVVLIVCAFIVEWRSLDRTLEKLSELPDQRYLLPLGPIGTLCAGSDEAGRDSDIAVGGQRNPRGSQSIQWMPREMAPTAPRFCHFPERLLARLLSWPCIRITVSSGRTTRP